MRRCYRPDYILADERFFEWYTHPPRMAAAGDTLPVIGAFWGARLVGHIFVIPHYFSNTTGGKTPMVWNSNFMVDPEFQQKGIGPVLIRHLFDDGSIFVSAGTGASLQQKGGRDLLTTMGFRFAFMKKYVFLFGKEGLGLLEGVKPRDQEIVENSIMKRERYKGVSTKSMKLVGLDGRITGFWQRYGARRFYGTWRDEDFFTWRYVSHPFFKYHAHMLFDEERDVVRGVAVWRLADVPSLGRRVGRIVEFLAEDGYGEMLAEKLLRALQVEGAAMADFFTTTDVFEEPLAALGFISSEDFTARVPRLLDPLSGGDPFVNLVAKNIRDPESGPDFQSFSRWYATAADGDQDRPNTVPLNE